MSKRFDNKRLIYLLSGLVLLLAVTFIFKVPREKSTLKAEVIDFDTAEVSKIILYPKISKDKPVEFNRLNGKWTVGQGSIVSATQKGAVHQVFEEIMKIQPQSLAAKSENKWKEFELTDSLATRIVFQDKGGKVLGDLLVGKFSYKQVNSPYGGNSIEGTSYVRLQNEKEIYAVEGFLSLFFNQKFDEWRDKTFIHANQEDITSISFTYPSDSSFRLVKKDGAWYAGSMLADSTKVEVYLKSLANIDGQEIKDGFTPDLNPFCQLQVDGDNLLNYTVKCFAEPGSTDYILNSSMNPEVYFISKKDGIFGKLFKSPNSFRKK